MKKDFVVNDPKVKTLLDATKTAQAALAGVYAEFEVALNPSDSLGAARLLLSEAKTADEIRIAQSRLFSLQGEAAELGRSQARRMVARAYHDLSVTIGPLLDAAIKTVDGEHAKAIEVERKWFATHGLGHEATQMSRRYKRLHDELHGMKTSLSANRQFVSMPTRGAFSNVIGWFA